MLEWTKGRRNRDRIADGIIKGQVIGQCWGEIGRCRPKYRCSVGAARALAVQDTMGASGTGWEGRREQAGQGRYLGSHHVLGWHKYPPLGQYSELGGQDQLQDCQDPRRPRRVSKLVDRRGVTP